MIRIDTKLVKENFVKYYGGEEKGIKTYKSCYPIVLYGAGFEKTGLVMGGLSTSIDTQVAIREINEKKFSIIHSGMNTLYECKTEDLNEFTGDKLIKAMFRACAMLKGNMNGAEIYIEYSIDDRFKCPLTALISALGSLKNGKIPEMETVKCLMEGTDEIKKIFLPAALYGRRNTLVSREAGGKWQYIAFKTSGYLMVISYSDIKEVEFKNAVTDAFNELKEEYSVSNELEFYHRIKETKLSTDNKLKNYIINECKRSELINREKAVNKNSGEIVKKSAYELFGIFGKSLNQLQKMYEISEFTGLSDLIAPLYDIGGICAFVKEENVDDYCRIFSKEYKKKAGEIPTLCICDTDDSAVVSDIKSE